MTFVNKIIEIYLKYATESFSKEEILKFIYKDFEIPPGVSPSLIEDHILDVLIDKKLYRKVDTLEFEFAHHGLIELISSKEEIKLKDEWHNITHTVELVINNKSAYKCNIKNEKHKEKIIEDLRTLVDHNYSNMNSKIEAVLEIFSKGQSIFKVLPDFKYCIQKFMLGENVVIKEFSEKKRAYNNAKTSFMIKKYINYLYENCDKDPQYILGIGSYIKKNIDNWVNGDDEEIKKPVFTSEVHKAYIDTVKMNRVSQSGAEYSSIFKTIKVYEILSKEIYNKTIC